MNRILEGVTIFHSWSHSTLCPSDLVQIAAFVELVAGLGGAVHGKPAIQVPVSSAVCLSMALLAQELSSGSTELNPAHHLDGDVYFLCHLSVLHLVSSGSLTVIHSPTVIPLRTFLTLLYLLLLAQVKFPWKFVRFISLIT